MNKYLYSGVNAFYGRLAYRGNFIAGLFNLMIQIGLSIFMWLAIYRFSDSTEIAGMSVSQMMVYLLIVNLLSLLFTFSPLFRLGELIHSGKLTAYLLRPINIFGQGLFEYFGENLFYVVIFLVLFLIFSPLIHVSAGLTCLAVVGTLLTVVMFYLMITLLGISGFWLIQLWPLRSVLSAMYLLLGGRYFPLQSLPQQYSWLTYNPFSLAGNELSMMYLGKIDAYQLMLNLSAVISWIVLFTIIIYFLWKKGLRHYEGVGN